MAAFGQIPSDVVVLEAAQTDDAIQAMLVVLLRLVHEQRDGGDDGGVETFGGRAREGGDVEREGGEAVEPGRAEHPRDGHGAPPPPVVGVCQEPLCVDVEEQDEEDDEE